jgi:hypothetical protein
MLSPGRDFSSGRLNMLFGLECLWYSGKQVPSFDEDHEPEAKDMQKNHHNLCDPSQSHQTEISSHPQQPDGLGGPESECHPRGMEK